MEHCAFCDIKYAVIDFTQGAKVAGLSAPDFVTSGEHTHSPFTKNVPNCLKGKEYEAMMGFEPGKLGPSDQDYKVQNQHLTFIFAKSVHEKVRLLAWLRSRIWKTKAKEKMNNPKTMMKFRKDRKTSKK